MAIQLSDNLKINVGAPIDSKYLNGFNAPYADVLEVNTTIPIAQRYIGLTVNILNVEYWYETGVADIDLVTKGSGGGSGSGERIEKNIIQVSHTFSVGDIITYSGGTYIKAIADGTQGGEVIGFVSEVLTLDQFVVIYAGYVEGASISGLALSPSTTYYLSSSVAGGIQSSNPTVFGHISKPILVTFDTSSALVYQYRGFVISSGATGGGGATSGITEIVNLSGGTGEIYSSSVTTFSGETAQLRTLLGLGSTTITTSGNTVIIDSSADAAYTGASPSNIEVGGVPVGTSLTGLTLSEIIEDMLITIFTPTFINPNNAFSDDAANTQEVGVTAATINYTATFDQGDIILEGIPVSGRSGLPNTYNYTGTGLPATTASTSLTDVQAITNYVILLGIQSWTNSVSYDEGPQPLDSIGDPFGSPLPSGTTSVKSLSITGIHPWFYGTFASGGAVAGANRPSPDQTLINSGTKMLGNTNGTLIVPSFGASGDDYVWFAIPSTATAKTIWYVNALSNGGIGGVVSPGGNLFPSPTTDGAINIPINSPTGLWSGVNYDIYIANKQQAATYMEFRNS